MRDDTINEDSDVKEAIHRLPEPVYNDRMFRIKRALDLSMKHQVLPKDQWIKYEEDLRYLEPYLVEVICERREREEWQIKSNECEVKAPVWCDVWCLVFKRICICPNTY
ncbi:cytochrome b-c1 complex subunit 7-like [Myxocyprinus asiaticus]|uniref:cytochrome b-c1 complex subunit 7-like n=1 Tax=Myxocyprinus asiaticus TaxID=70543 RepID=UPI00222198FF|nr:cytochrome b-c1 complex subunit 7-like [Myxocyprinus asiaticus]